LGRLDKNCVNSLLSVSVTERRFHLLPGHACRELEWKYQCLLLRINQSVSCPIWRYSSQTSHGII